MGKMMRSISRFTLAVVAAVAVLSQTQQVAADETQTAPVAPQDVVIPEPPLVPIADEPMLIIPAEKLPLPSTGVVLDDAGAPVPNAVNMNAYRLIYKSIPFSRASIASIPTIDTIRRWKS